MKPVEAATKPRVAKNISRLRGESVISKVGLGIISRGKAQQFEYGFDEIGNRLTTKAGGNAYGAGLRPASYAPNRLNEYSQRTVPAAIDVLGAAAVNATVTVEGQTADRRGAYFWKETALNNATAPVWEQINVVSGANQDNRYAFLPQTPEQFAYDLDGNLTSDGRWDYTWDAENRVVKMVSRSGAPSGSERWMEFEYDWKGRRIAKKVWNNNTGTGTPALEQKFVYDAWNLLAILNPQLSTINSFVWGLDLSSSEQGAGGVGGLLAVTDQSTINNAPSTHFPTYDGNGNVVALVYAADDATTTTVNEAGMVSASYEYGPFGELIRMTGPMSKANPFRFSTKYQDDETDQLYYGYRSYNPTTGRWLNRDPIFERGGINLYDYVKNSPITLIDPFGKSWLSSCGNFLCARAAAGGANNQILLSGINGNDDRGGGNAFRHCLSGCEVSKQCGKGGETSWDGRENPNTDAGRQDLANNRVGYDQAKKEGSCWNNCMSAWENGGLQCGGNPCPPPAQRVPEPVPGDPGPSI